MVSSSRFIAIVLAITAPSFAVKMSKFMERQMSSDLSASRPSQTVVKAAAELQSGDAIYLQNPSHDNQYVECHGQGEVYGISTTSNKDGERNGIPTTKFTINKFSGAGPINDGDVIYLKNPSRDDHFVECPAGGGEGGHAVTTAGTMGTTTPFTIHLWSGTGAIKTGDAVFFRSPSRDNHYLEVHGFAGDGYAISTTGTKIREYNGEATTLFTVHNWESVVDLDLDGAEMVKDEDSVVRFNGIMGQGIADLVITNMTSYTPSTLGVDGSADATGIDGEWGRINIACGTSTEFKFSFVSSESGNPFTMEAFHLTFADLDTGVDGHCTETISIAGCDDYTVSTDTELDVYDSVEDGTAYKVFSATKEGDGDDNPQNVTFSDEQANRAVSLLFKDIQSFTVRYSTSGEGYAGRLIYFAGKTSLSPA